MRLGVDYAFFPEHPDPAGLAAAGKTFAMRYVGPGTDDKHLHADERDALWAVGIELVLLVEGTANGALGGSQVGAGHASMALAAAHGLGAPDTAPMYFAVDFDVTAAQWPTVANYLTGAASVIGAGRVGIYGGVRAMQWAARDRVAQWFFQTFAWSRDPITGLITWFAGNHVEQYQNDVALAGGTVDLCRARRDQFGQWGSGAPREEDDMPVLKRDPATGAVWVANYVMRRHVASQAEWVYLRTPAADGGAGLTDLGDLKDGESIDWYGADVDDLDHPPATTPPGFTHDELVQAAFEGAQRAEKE